MHVIAVHKYLTHAALRPRLTQKSQNKTHTLQGHPNADKSLPCLTKGMAKEQALSLRAQAQLTCIKHTHIYKLSIYYAANLAAALPTPGLHRKALMQETTRDLRSLSTHAAEPLVTPDDGVAP